MNSASRASFFHASKVVEINPISAIIVVKHDVAVPNTHPLKLITSVGIIGTRVEVAVGVSISVGYGV